MGGWVCTRARAGGLACVRARAGAPPQPPFSVLCVAPALSQHLEAVLHLNPEKALGQGLHLFYNIYNHYFIILHIFL